LGFGGVISATSSFQHGKLKFMNTREVSMIYGIEISASPVDNVTVDGDPKGGVNRVMRHMEAVLY